MGEFASAEGTFTYDVYSSARQWPTVTFKKSIGRIQRKGRILKLRLRSNVGSISQAEVRLILVHGSAYRRVQVFDASNDVPTCSDQRLEDQKV